MNDIEVICVKCGMRFKQKYGHECPEVPSDDEEIDDLCNDNIRLRKALRETLKFLTEAPFDFHNGVEGEDQGDNEGEYYGATEWKRIVDLIREALRNEQQKKDTTN